MNFRKFYKIINEATETDRYTVHPVGDGDFYIWDNEKQEYATKEYFPTKEEALNKIEELENPIPGKSNDLIQCVIKIKDIGNAWEFIEILKDDTNFNDDTEMEDYYWDDLLKEEKEILYVIAYHPKGVTDKFYNEFGEEVEFEN